MSDLIFATFRRLFKGRLFWIGILAMAGLGVTVTVARARDNAVLPGMGYNTPDGTLFVALTYFPIVVAALTSLFIGAEHSDGTWRNKTTVGYGKLQIYIAYFAVTCTGLLVMYISYIVTVLGLSAVLLDPFHTPISVNTVFFFCSLFTVIAMNAITVALCMLIQNRAVIAVGSMLLAIGMLMGGVAIYNALEQPEFITSDVAVNDENGDTFNGESQLITNPKYPTGAKRAVLEFLHDFLPGGQVITIGMSDKLPSNIGELPLLSVFFALISTLGGAWGFCRRDLK